MLMSSKNLIPYEDKKEPYYIVMETYKNDDKSKSYVKCVERFMNARGRPEENIPHEYQTKVVYRVKENDIAVKPGMLPRITAGYDFELTDEQHEKLIEEISKKIPCIVISK